MSGEAGASLDQATLARRDPGGMLRLVGETPRMMRSAWQLSRGLELPDRHRQARSVAVIGMGGSAAAGDLVRGIFGDRLRAPIVSVRDYDLPAWVGPDTLVVAASHSGSTEETISAFSAALSRRCPAVVISSGGPLAQVASRVGLPSLVYANESQPRAALGYGLVLLAGLLERAGLLDLAEEEVEAAARAAESIIEANQPSVPTDDNRAKQLAWSLVGRLPVVEASGYLAPVARRWKTQLNENAKSGALAEELPEATHNTVVGYEHPDTVRDHLYVILLSSALEHPRNARRATISTQLLNAAGIAHELVPLAGEGRLGQAASAIVLGDYVSVYLALLYGVDPTPVEAIDVVKAGMSDEPNEDDDWRSSGG
ncbi:MAG TPA: bifunctional phosphoglucose/phosphomannose isomerase [Candidatus Limnocylindrales bacterium]|nr:bifunctional phosphoglucose/phosphomannose isomerase [Candidatus Limnocylindrales bacterium]